MVLDTSVSMFLLYSFFSFLWLISSGRRRKWFLYEEALAHLTTHKPLMAQWLLDMAKAEAPR